MFFSSFIFAMILVYGCAALFGVGKHVSKKVSRYGARSMYDDDYDPWNLRQLKLRNNTFKDGPLWILRSDFDGSRYHAIIKCTHFQKEFNVYGYTLEELENKIDAEYINIMNQYESITGMEYFEYKDGLTYGWKDGKRIVTGRL